MRQTLSGSAFFISLTLFDQNLVTYLKAQVDYPYKCLSLPVKHITLPKTGVAIYDCIQIPSCTEPESEQNWVGEGWRLIGWP